MFKVSVYVPSVSDGERISDQRRGEVLDRVRTVFSKEFGGYTMYEACGGCVLSNGALEEEDVTVVYAFADATLSHIKLVLLEVALYVKESLNQDSVLVTFAEESVSFI